MAIDKAVDSAVLEANLTTIANAIREKAGTSDALAFPAGFAEAIAGIETGGGEIAGVSKFVSGSFVLAENYTSKYTIVSDAEALAPLMDDGISWTMVPVKSFMCLWATPKESDTDFSAYPNTVCLYASVPGKKSVGAATAKSIGKVSSSGSVSTANVTSSPAYMTMSSASDLVFGFNSNSNYLGYAGTEYHWFVARCW